MDAIRLEEVTHCYGARTALERVTMSVAAGEVFGFVGPNGAGKTTTLRIIATLLRPTEGEVYVNGLAVKGAPQEIRRLVGYMPEEFGTYPDLLVEEYLDFFAACYGIAPNRRTRLVGELLELVDLAHRRQDYVDRLSRGLKQRLSLARALIHDPQILLLDEPASGLDPRARVEMRELLVEMASMGKTIFFSSHILADVAQICTRVGIIEAGRLVAVGNLEELRLSLLRRRRVEVTLLGGLERAEALLRTLPGVTALERANAKEDNEHVRLLFDFEGEDADLSQLLTYLIHEGLPVLHFYEERDNLEEVFLHATKGLVS